MEYLAAFIIQGVIYLVALIGHAAKAEPPAAPPAVVETTGEWGDYL